MKQPGVSMQLALAVASLAVSMTVGGYTLGAPLWAVVCAGSAAVAWMVRVLVRARDRSVGDVGLLMVMVIGSALAAGPTYGISLYPVAGGLVIVLGKTAHGRWRAWAWPVLAASSAVIGFVVGAHEPVSVGITALTIAIATLAGRARRRNALEVESRFAGLDRQYAADLARMQVSVDRLLLPTALRTRFLGLTPREAEVLALICRGRSNDEIAVTLSITVATVKGYVNSLFAKLAARDRAQTIALVLGTTSHGASPHALTSSVTTDG
ncbi:LuxR C-terminal-related transcriptional regulator [Curtobacterium sp. MCPF17_011]|uniref:helix-turn-helix transcriptional regulator n=1 Tax=Curtobacterium sp. MCPF17_011 TaxID=2175652 RepID=UPI0021ABC223|nr:LuxR C-terminal-related transcriptional regulator [Curtobacterium sp. MCPF17_011]